MELPSTGHHFGASSHGTITFAVAGFINELKSKENNASPDEATHLVEISKFDHLQPIAG